MTPFERIEFAFLRRDTNNGKSYCIECGGNERKGKVKHKLDCVLVEANAALVQVERETIARVVAWLRNQREERGLLRSVDALAHELESGAWKGGEGDG